MKKVIALMIALLMVLSGCSGNEAELDSLRQEAERLQQVETENVELKQEVERLHQVETENAELKQEVEELQEELYRMQNPEPDDNEELAVDPSKEVKPSDSLAQDMLDYLDAQVQSNEYEDWNGVAKCDYATEQHLLEVAKKCATIKDAGSSDWAVSIAENISNNPACTGKALKELANSENMEVWFEAAESDYADEESLIAVAKSCASITTNESEAFNLAISIRDNPACTSKALKELVNSPYSDVRDFGHQLIENMQ